MAKLIGEALGLKAILTNDANAAAFGECWMGSGHQFHSIVLLTLGTGVGGGIIIVPGLMFALGMDQRRAHGTSLGGVFLISLSSFFTYWTHDHIDWPVVLWLSIGSVAGSGLRINIM